MTSLRSTLFAATFATIALASPSAFAMMMMPMGGSSMPSGGGMMMDQMQMPSGGQMGNMQQPGMQMPQAAPQQAGRAQFAAALEKTAPAQGFSALPLKQTAPTAAPAVPQPQAPISGRLGQHVDITV